MFLFPDFYRVAVSSAGNHDQRGYLSLWGETYQGMPNGDNYAGEVKNGEGVFGLRRAFVAPKHLDRTA